MVRLPRPVLPAVKRLFGTLSCCERHQRCSNPNAFRAATLGCVGRCLDVVSRHFGHSGFDLQLCHKLVSTILATGAHALRGDFKKVLQAQLQKVSRPGTPSVNRRDARPAGRPPSPRQGATVARASNSRRWAVQIVSLQRNLPSAEVAKGDASAKVDPASVATAVEKVPRRVAKRRPCSQHCTQCPCLAPAGQPIPRAVFRWSDTLL